MCIGNIRKKNTANSVGTHLEKVIFPAFFCEISINLQPKAQIGQEMKTTDQYILLILIIF